MLQISNIKKDYILKDQSVSALKGISINFRRHEFAAILGPSGCGKTTLLNIIGGLDRYTSGDLIIDGVSTKEYKDKDWDNYRNHRVGFVFQSYNLIQHQTILENVELALTLSGVKKADRRKRATQVLEKVGLGDKLKSKPNQLSGGQMQRVAIARALVNDPEIILADEPTGALDSKTSVQIMDILKEVSQDRLVIMVTHNPELANKYANRIIRLFDGELTEDSNPYSDKQAQKDIEKSNKEDQKKEDLGFKKTEKKKSMSFFTALSLSLKNMMTKMGRTLMVSFAGSIGIIGIALILAVSAGLTSYIDNMQSESLSSYPVSVSAIAIDYDSVLNTIDQGMDTGENADNSINVYDPSTSLISLGKYNYISQEFIDYINEYYSREGKSELLNDYLISYASDMRLVTYDGTTYKAINSEVSTSALSGATSSLFFEEVDQEYVLSLYDMKGTNAHYPSNKNEVALVVGDNGLSIAELASLGIDIEYQTDDQGNIMNDSQGQPIIKNIAYDDVIGKTYRLLYNDAYYDTDLLPKYDFSNSSISQDNLSELYNDTDNTEDLTITCVLIHKEDTTGSIFSNGIMYTHELANAYRENSKASSATQSIRDFYLNQSGEFKSLEVASTPFAVPYVVNISEVEQYLQNPSTDEANYFSYTSPMVMKQTLQMALGVSLSDSEIIDLYLQMYGASDIPNSVYFYAKNFEAKDDLVVMLDAWNADHADNQITLTDRSAMITNLLGTLVDIISYVLVAFAGISLIVSSVMIGIITYTSVIERTKEIGVLRSIGASKRDISRVFNAETTIIGLTAGILGILIAGLLTIPISLILKSLTGIGGLAVMQPLSSLILVLISVFLTFIAGLIPARIASKKDPVIALRSE